ncbi:MAG TPA: CocE/NonD family hydrolase, partial [Ktedonobacteraceae bacterium]|nr:CocE/NonD family hydrolase [Ktedonobacteraceae bacterium]
MAMQMGQEITVDFDVPATMRDGTVLRSNVYRPAGEGQWPVLLTRLPYGKDFPIGTAILDPAQVARRGYVVIVQDTRGRVTSEGEWNPFHNEDEDGFDTIEWASKLLYSNGSVGMFGISYFGFTQWAAAVLQPPALKAMIPVQTWNDPLNGVLFREGALQLGLANWDLQMNLDVLMRRHRGNPQALGRAIYMLVGEMDSLAERGYWELPLKDFAPFTRQGIDSTFFQLVEKPMDSSSLDHMTLQGKRENVTVPTFNIAGRYDIFLQDTIDNFTFMRKAGSTPEARQSKLLIGPWSHGGMTNPIGDVNFGFGASAAYINLQIDLGSLQVRWFDHWLKGIDTGMM